MSELRAGYKQTEIGVIPVDWEVTSLGEIVDYTKGYPFKSSEYQVSGVRIIRVSDTTYDSITDKNAMFISEAKAHQFLKWGLHENDLVVSTVGSKPPMYDSMVGKPILISKQYEGSLLNQNAVNLRSKFNREFIQQILVNHLRTKRYVLFIEGIFRGNANQASITLNELFSYGIPLPSDKLEQRAIAIALGDVDALISSQDALIAKKRDIKHAAMQQLLTGKQRLPGFSGEWELKTLREVTDCLDNLRVPLNEAERGQMQGDYPYCGANGVLDYVNDYVIDDDIILMAEDGGYFDEYAYRPIAYRMIGKCWVNNHAHILKAKKEFSHEYIFYSLVHKNILEFLASGTRAKLNKSEMYKIEINMPVEKLEQTTIAKVLSDMDAEITALESERNKTKLLKQGMMQELLTGRTRLV